MSQLNSMAIPMEGKYSKSELLELKNKMNAKALAKRRSTVSYTHLTLSTTPYV